MAVGINNGLVGTPAESLTYDSNYPSEGGDNTSQQWHDNNAILQAQIENIQAKEIILSNDLSGSVLMDSGNDAVTLVATLSTAYLPTAGGSMNGAITLLADPANPLEASTKQYVDNEIITAISSIGSIVGLNDKLDIAGGTMTGNLNMGGNQITGLSNATPGAADAISRGYADSRYLISTAASFSSNVTLTAIPTLPNHLTTKGYVDDAVTALVDTAPGALDTLNELAAAIGDDANFAGTMTTSLAGKVNKAGDTMTGQLILNADPTVSLGASTKQYVDNGLSLKSDTTHNHDSAYSAITHNHDLAYSSITHNHNTEYYTQAQTDSMFFPVSGGSLTGALTLASDPTLALEAATKQYVDSVSGTGVVENLVLQDNNNDGVNSISAIGSFTNIDIEISPKGTGLVLASSGYNMSTGPYNSFTTKQYVDNAVSATIGGKVNRVGDTMTGELVLFGDPTTPLGAATKQYVDAASTGHNHNILTSDDGSTDTDIILRPKGTGLVVVDFGYDMSVGSPEALTTKGYVDTQLSNQISNHIHNQVVADDGNTDTDLVLIPKGTGLVVVPSGYDMSAGGIDAITTRGYVDTEINAVTSDFLQIVDANNDGFVVCGVGGTATDIDLQLTAKGAGTVVIGDPLINLGTSIVEATGSNTDVDLQFLTKGTGLILTGSGYDMSIGPAGSLTTKGYVDGELLTKSDTTHNHDASYALATHNHDLNYSAVSHDHDLTYVNSTGDTMTGALVLAADPTANLEAATKQYVDTAVSSSVTSLTSSASLLFPTLASLTSADLTITVTGAVIGNEVALGLSPTIISGLVFNAFVSAADTVTVRVTNASGAPINPVAETFNVRVFQ